MHTRRQMSRQDSLAVDSVVYLGAEGRQARRSDEFSSGAVREQEAFLGNMPVCSLVS